MITPPADFPGYKASIRDAIRDVLAEAGPGGRLLVSGPTESVFYKLGRRVAGPEDSGAYHERGIGEVRRLLGDMVPVRTVASLYPPVTLFDIFAGTRRAA